MALIIERLEVPPFLENTYVVGDRESGQAFVVDPGGAVGELERLLAARGLAAKAIVNTHAHIDHVAGAADAKKRFGIPFWLHSGDAPWLQALPAQSAMFGFPASDSPTVDRWIEDGEELSLGRTRARVLHTPGHTPGGCCLYFEADKVLLTGDTLFVGSIGRTDFPGGSFEQLLESIRGKLFPLGDDVVFYPGHGPSGRLGDERRSNPFVGDRAVGAGG